MARKEGMEAGGAGGGGNDDEQNLPDPLCFLSHPHSYIPALFHE